MLVILVMFWMGAGCWLLCMLRGLLDLEGVGIADAEGACAVESWSVGFVIYFLPRVICRSWIGGGTAGGSWDGMRVDVKGGL